MADRLLRRPEVEKLTGLSRSSIYAMMQDGAFPVPRRIGRRAVAWQQSDIENWITGRQPTLLRLRLVASERKPRHTRHGARDE